MKKELLIVFIFLIPLVFAISSTNYDISSPTVGSGGNASSTNYQSSLVLEDIVGSISSSSYNQFLGFFFAEGKTNVAPDNPSVNLQGIGGTNKTTENLNCSATITDDDDSTLNVSVTWYNDDGLNQTTDFNNSYANASLFYATLTSGNTSKNQNWTCSVRVYDGEDFSSWGNSSALRVLNSLPTVTLDSPSDENTTTNRTPAFSWNTGSDDDSDALTYDLNLTCYPGCSDDNRLIEDLSGTSRTLGGFLVYLSDNNFYYNWTVRAKDDEGVGAWAATRNIGIQSSIVASLPNSTVNFGSFVSGTNDTTNDAPLPFLMQNDGNCLLNVTINATDLWTNAANPSNYYQYKSDNKSGEEGGFDWDQSQTSWANMSSSPVVMMVELNWSDSKDSFEVDLNVTVPDQEVAGSKASTVYFVSSLGE